MYVCVCVCVSEMARGQQNVNKSYFYHLAINTEFLAPAMLNLWPLFMSEKRKPQTCCHTFCPLPPPPLQDPFWPALCIHFICRFGQEKEIYTSHIIAIFQLLRPRRSFKEAQASARQETKPNRMKYEKLHYTLINTSPGEQLGRVGVGLELLELHLTAWYGAIYISPQSRA